ncbi:COG4583 Sarcosine oxidase gamma subunit [Rhabdaerophilaceae bacterium]
MMMKNDQARIDHLPMMAMFDLRGSKQGLTKALAGAGFTMPEGRNHLERHSAGVELAQLGPQRVLVLADLSQEAQLNAGFSRGFGAVADADFALVSDMFVGFDLRGQGAEDVLSQGAPLDLSHESFPIGCTTGTELWSTSVIIMRLAGHPDHFRILVERSYAGYIEDWLHVASGRPSNVRPGVMSSPPSSIRPA